MLLFSGRRATSRLGAHVIPVGCPVTQAEARSTPCPAAPGRLALPQKKGYPPACAICGIAPSCCIRPNWSSMPESSTYLPPAMRAI
jgi:hypothetical protein